MDTEDLGHQIYVLTSKALRDMSHASNQEEKRRACIDLQKCEHQIIDLLNVNTSTPTNAFEEIDNAYDMSPYDIMTRFIIPNLRKCCLDLEELTCTKYSNIAINWLHRLRLLLLHRHIGKNVEKYVEDEGVMHAERKEILHDLQPLFDEYDAIDHNEAQENKFLDTLIQVIRSYHIPDVSDIGTAIMDVVDVLRYDKSSQEDKNEAIQSLRNFLSIKPREHTNNQKAKDAMLVNSGNSLALCIRKRQDVQKSFEKVKSAAKDALNPIAAKRLIAELSVIVYNLSGANAPALDQTERDKIAFEVELQISGVCNHPDYVKERKAKFTR